ncbi:MAG: hypothetical protein V1894_05285 [Chloroflexota bacterium]
MSCYFRHLNEVLVQAGIAVTRENRKQVDAAIHKLMGVDYKDCPATWETLKGEILTSEERRRDFIRKLRSRAGAQLNGTLCHCERSEAICLFIAMLGAYCFGLKPSQ